MLLELTEREIQEIEDLREIFKDCYVNDVKVDCFNFICEMIYDKIDERTLTIEERRFLISQLIESKEWLLSLNCNVELIKKLIECIKEDC